MAASAWMKLYTSLYIQQQRGAVQFSVKLYDLCRKNWSVDQ